MAPKSFLSIRNWDKYQHYKNRRPAWIKLYHHSLDDWKLNQLPPTTRLLWFQLLLLAARCDNMIPNDVEWISKRVEIPVGSVREGIVSLRKGAWLTGGRASKMLALEEKRREEIEKPINGDGPSMGFRPPQAILEKLSEEERKLRLVGGEP